MVSNKRWNVEYPGFRHSNTQEYQELQMGFKLKFDELAKREQCVKNAEADIARQRADVEAQIQQLNMWRRVLDESVARYQQERTNWEYTVGAMPKTNYRQHMEENMQSLVERFGQTFQEMQSLRNDIRELDATLRETDWDAVCALCELHRRLESLNTEETLREADHLAMILKKYYQLESIEPVLGSSYSNVLHERLDQTHNGKFVLRCCSKGWMSNNNVVNRALVETTDVL